MSLVTPHCPHCGGRCEFCRSNVVASDQPTVRVDCPECGPFLLEVRTNPEPRMSYMPHQHRVIAEKNELDERLDKLTAFLATPSFTSLPKDEQERLTKQHSLMTELSAVLEARILHFP